MKVTRILEQSKSMGLPISTCYHLISKGLLPPPIKLGSRCSVMIDSEIEAVLRARSTGATDDDIKLLVESLVADRRNAA